MKISAISDLHGNLPKPDFFDSGDVLCICGDVVPLNIQRDLVETIAWFCLKFIPWTDKLPFEKVIMIPGNHDFAFEEIGPKRCNNGNDIESMLMPESIKGEHKLKILLDNGYKYKGVTFYGTPWCPDLMSWAFYGNSEKLQKEFDKIPQNVDVLLSHCPPKFDTVGTVLQNGTFNYLRDFGCQELADAILNKMPKWVFCGHVHTGNHTPVLINSLSNVVNVSMLDESYKKSYKPFIIEI